jgi:hypothetical protein
MVVIVHGDLSIRNQQTWWYIDPTNLEDGFLRVITAGQIDAGVVFLGVGNMPISGSNYDVFFLVDIKLCWL